MLAANSLDGKTVRDYQETLQCILSSIIGSEHQSIPESDLLCEFNLLDILGMV